MILVRAWAVLGTAGVGAPALGEPRGGLQPVPPPVPPRTAKRARPRPRAIPGTVIYRSAFGAGGTDGWSGDKALPLEKGTALLRPLHNQTVRLSLAKIPPHKFLHVRLDLHLRESWDGSGIASGGDVDVPDAVTVRLAGGPTLLHASFAVVRNCLQSYPDNGLWANHSARTGAARDLEGGQYGGSLYALSFTFPHVAPKAVLEITGKLTETRPENRTAENENWGIGNVAVSVLGRSPVRLDDARFARLWADLAHKDPVRANEAVWALVAAGADALPRIEKALGASRTEPLAKRAADLIRRLDADDWRVREQATKQLAAMGPAVRPLLRKALAGRPSPEVKSRLEHLLSDEGPAPERVRASRLRWVLQVIGGRRAVAMRAMLPVPKPHVPAGPKRVDTPRDKFLERAARGLPQRQRAAAKIRAMHRLD